MKKELQDWFDSTQRAFDNGMRMTVDSALKSICGLDSKQKVQVHTGLFVLYSNKPICASTAYKRVSKDSTIYNRLDYYVNSFQLIDGVIFIGM